MQAIHLSHGRLSLVEKPQPQPQAGEALIRVLCAGICNTDLELVQGYYPYEGTLGHEFVGRVEQGPSEWLGKRVCGEINAACGDCDACRHARRSHCPNRTVLGIVARDGAFAEFLTLPVENLVAVPESVADHEAVFTEPLAAALEIAEQITIRPTDRIVVIGDGKLGLLAAQVLSLRGSSLIALGRHQRKLNILAKRGIRTLLVQGRETLNGLCADVVVEATGNPEGFALAREILRPRGILVLKSTYHSQLQLDISRIVVDELTLIGSRCGPFVPALELLARRLVEVETLIDARFPLNQGVAAFEKSRQPGVLKVLLTKPAGSV